MTIRKCFVFCLFAAVSGVLSFTANCKQPPTEKVIALRNDFNDCESRGARVFAQPEYDQVKQKMADLTSLMTRKKYKQADILADAVSTDLETLKIKLETIGRNKGKENLAGVYAELEKMKTLLSSENYKSLGKDEGQHYELKYAGFVSRVSDLENDLENSAFLRVCNGSRVLKDDIIISTEKINQRMEIARASPRRR